MPSRRRSRRHGLPAYDPRLVMPRLVMPRLVMPWLVASGVDQAGG